MPARRPPLVLLGVLALVVIALLGWRSSVPAPSSFPPGLIVGSTWQSPTGIDCIVEEIQGEWVRVSARAFRAGRSPSAIWIHGATGAVWTRS